MALVNAKCTNCGGNLEVDDIRDAAICPYCKSAYIVKDAINIYNSFSGSQESLAVLLKRATDFKSIGRTSEAQTVYDQITMLFPLCAEAWFELGKMKITKLLFPNREKSIDWREFHGCCTTSQIEKKIRNKYKCNKSLESIISDFNNYIETNADMNTSRKIWGDFKFNYCIENFKREVENSYKLLEAEYNNKAELIIKESKELIKKCLQDITFLDGYGDTFDPDSTDYQIALLDDTLYFIENHNFYKYSSHSTDTIHFAYEYADVRYDKSALSGKSLTLLFAYGRNLIVYNGRYLQCLYKSSSYSKERYISVLQNCKKMELQWKKNKCCSYCGGWYTGLFSKKCSQCGLIKNY